MMRTITHFAGDDFMRLATAHALRFEVFCTEQGVSIDLEMDGQDDACIHFLLSEEQIPVATARARPIADATFKIERMAVKRTHRGGGIGRDLMKYILDEIQTNGARTAILHAQTAVEDFYRRLGFSGEGDVYMEAGIPHRTMRQSLASN